jgi:hypothetical protein
VKTLLQIEECGRESEADDDRDNLPGLAGLTPEEKMQMWTRPPPDAPTDSAELTPLENTPLRNGPESDAVDEEYSNLPGFEEDEDYTITHFAEAWKFLTESHAYKWLIGKMKCGILLTEFNGTPIEHISNEITRGLKAVNRVHGYTTGVCKGIFEIFWDLPAFIDHEFPDETALQLGSIITITGQDIDAQALTCAEYMRQVWPTTGSETLKALQMAMDEGIGKPHKCKFLREVKIHSDFPLIRLRRSEVESGRSKLSASSLIVQTLTHCRHYNR